MTGVERRLNGWKAIAGFFGRDRTTVARWAKERGLPVHHIPGGKQKSVFALEHELEAWRSHFADLSEEVPPAQRPATDPPARKSRAVWILAASLIGIGVIAGGAYYFRPSDLDRSAVPAGLMADYVSARDIWARRTPDDIRESIRRYEKIIQQAPDFALARVGLAEAWLIYREYGDVGDARAFGIARIAAQKAAALDPNLASAHRALGFIDYWWDNDPVNAVAEFRRAIELDPRDSQSQFWFANVLADLGQDRAAERHYARARELAPGSQPIAVEHACAQWQAGRDGLALSMLTALKTHYPADATISNCLAWVHIGLGDIQGFSVEYSRTANLRGEPDMLRLAGEIEAAIKRDPATAYLVLIADNRRELAAGTRRIREVPAFYASSMGDRRLLLQLMREAHIAGERWYSPSITSRIAARWKGDRDILGLLVDLRVDPPKIDVP